MKNLMKWLVEEESGQAVVEYVLLLGLVAVSLLVVAKEVGEKILETYEAVINKIEAANI